MWRKKADNEVIGKRTAGSPKYEFEVDEIEVVNRVTMRLKLDPDDGRVIHRDIDLVINWDDVNALEARMLANRKT